MEVYGDARVVLTVDEAQTTLLSLRRRLEEAEPGSFARHAAAVQLLVAGGRIAQAALDGECAARDEDQVTPLAHAAHRLLLALGAQVVDSWDALVATQPPTPTSSPLDAGVVADFFAALAPTPAALETRVPEGYAHYALYPETNLEAARRLAVSDAFVTTQTPLVLGVRSIGTSLGAVVAATLGGALLTVRPREPR